MNYLYCHPIFDERKWTHRFSYQLLCAFKNKGIDLNQFDYYGTGEAEGEFEEITLDSLKNDIIEYLKNDSYCLIGTRFGATLAFSCMIQFPTRVKKLIMIDPIINGSDYIEYVYRQQHIKDMLTGYCEKDLEDDEYINIEGYKTSKKLINQIKDCSLQFIFNKECFSTPIYYFDISKYGSISSDGNKILSVLKGNFPNMTICHVNIPMFWKRIPSVDYSELINKILELCYDLQ